MICSYFYAAGGFRIESGSALVTVLIDGQETDLRVIRNGSGRSRIDKGEISLSDLAEMFPEQESFDIKVTHNGVSIPLSLNPSSAMGRQGRESIKDLRDSLESLDPVSRKILAELQMETLPYGKEHSKEALSRLKWALYQADHLRVSEAALAMAAEIMDKEASVMMLERHIDIASHLALQVASGANPGLMVTMSQDLRNALSESGFLTETGTIPSLNGWNLSVKDIEDLASSGAVLDARFGALVKDVPLSVWSSMRNGGIPTFRAMKNSPRIESKELRDAQGHNIILQGNVWETQDGKFVFGAPPNSSWPEGVQVLARNPYEIAGLSPSSKEGRDLAVAYTAAVAAITDAGRRCIEVSAGRCSADGKCLECFVEPINQLREVARDITGLSYDQNTIDSTVIDALLYRATRGDEQAARDFQILSDLGERMIDLVKHPDIKSGITPRMREELVAFGYSAYKINDSMRTNALSTWRTEQFGKIDQAVARGDVSQDWSSHLKDEVVKWSNDVGFGNVYRDRVALDMQATQETFDSRSGGLKTSDLNLDDLFLIHETPYEPQLDAEGNVLLRPTGDYNPRLPRTSVHFTINHTAVGHMFRQGLDANHAVVARLSDVLERNPDSLNSLFAIDTHLSPMPGEPLVLPSRAVRVVDFDSVPSAHADSETERQQARTARVFKEIKDIDFSLTGDGERFIPAFPASTHYSSSPVDSRLGELARGLGVSTGIHQDQASSKFERIEPFEEMSHSSIHDYTFSVEDLADLSYASRARMMTHGRWPGVKASIVTDPNEESFV